MAGYADMSRAYKEGYEKARNEFERTTGTWKVTGKGYRGKTQDYACLQCSECGRKISYVHLEWSEDSFDEGLAKFLMKYPYCNCGAKMEGVVDNL